jgi:putative tryptophan/tyrosine transport system substrate-binding protein
MKRREFIKVVAGPAAIWPLAARAALASEASGQRGDSKVQQSGRMRRIGVLTTFGERDALAEGWLAAFRKGLEGSGWRDGRNVKIDYRWAVGDADLLAGFAKELVALQPDVIFAVTTPAVAALLQETRTLPIVFAQVSDPVGSGFVASLARPGGNVTGFTNINIESSIGGKWLELVKEVAPALWRVVMVYNPATSPFAGYYLRPFEAAGPAHGVQASAAAVDSDADIENALGALAREPGGGFVVLPDAFTGIHRDQIVSLAARYRLPAVYPFRWFAEIGGLLSYGIDSDDMFRRAASYVDRIFKGEKPADLPVQAPTKFEMVINLKTAKALGLAIPDKLLALADEVIE